MAIYRCFRAPHAPQLSRSATRKSPLPSPAVASARRRTRRLPLAEQRAAHRSAGGRALSTGPAAGTPATAVTSS